MSSLFEWKVLLQLYNIFNWSLLTLCKSSILLSLQSSEKRTVTQFHYTAWPDHGTPEELGLVQFHKAVTKSYQPGGLMLVHCRCVLFKGYFNIQLTEYQLNGLDCNWMA